MTVTLKYEFRPMYSREKCPSVTKEKSSSRLYKVLLFSVILKDILYLKVIYGFSVGISKSCDYPRPSTTTHDQP